MARLPKATELAEIPAESGIDPRDVTNPRRLRPGEMLSREIHFEVVDNVTYYSWTLGMNHKMLSLWKDKEGVRGAVPCGSKVFQGTYTLEKVHYIIDEAAGEVDIRALIRMKLDAPVKKRGRRVVSRTAF